MQDDSPRKGKEDDPREVEVNPNVNDERPSSDYQPEDNGGPDVHDEPSYSTDEDATRSCSLPSPQGISVAEYDAAPAKVRIL